MENRGRGFLGGWWIKENTKIAYTSWGFTLLRCIKYCPLSLILLNMLSDNVRSTDAKKHAGQNKLFITGKTSLQSRNGTPDFRVMLYYVRIDTVDLDLSI